jgi:hypothetical protein
MEEKQTIDDELDEKARELSLKQGISYQEAIKIARNKQKNIFDFS